VAEPTGINDPDLAAITGPVAVAAADRSSSPTSRSLTAPGHWPGQGLTPPVVTLCGSARFVEAFAEEQAQLSLAGWIVLSLSGVPKEQVDADGSLHARLDQLHRARIDMSQRVHVIDVAGYIGDSTRAEIEYAAAAGKTVTYLSADHVGTGLSRAPGT
jgi:hypothetical protein